MLQQPQAGPGASWPSPTALRPTHPASAALRVSPCHRLGDGALAGAELTQAAPQAMLDAGGQAWLLRAACQEASAWATLRSLPAGLRVTVALPRHGLRGGVLAQVEAALLGARLPGSGLVVALPQADLADAEPDLLLLVAALRDLGASVALDSQPQASGCEQVLRRLPLDTVRLHPALVQRAEQDADARDALSRSIRFAHRMDTLAVALGVSTAVQRDILADLRCDTGQGLLFGQDLPGPAFRASLH